MVFQPADELHGALSEALDTLWEIRQSARSLAPGGLLPVDEGLLNLPSHVRYSLTRREDPATIEKHPEEIRAMHEVMYDFQVKVNQNEDGSYMTDDQGMMLRNGGGASGSLNRNDTSSEAYRPRYPYIWERETGRK
jgi:hypothetical protein